MAEKDTKLILENPSSLISDEYYFKYIFKKTEKIVCAVFYILRNSSDIDKKDNLVVDLEETAQRTLTRVLDSLAVTSVRSVNDLEDVSMRLVGLESKLRVLHAAGYIHESHLDVFVAEIDSVLRSIRGFLERVTGPQVALRSLGDTRKRGGQLPKTTSGTIARTLDERVSESQSGSRKERVMAVLRAQPDASIKDISDTIKDCSEKTLQRELNSLIMDGTVIREGQRRWSKYSLA